MFPLRLSHMGLLSWMAAGVLGIVHQEPDRTFHQASPQATISTLQHAAAAGIGKSHMQETSFESFLQQIGAVALISTCAISCLVLKKGLQEKEDAVRIVKSASLGQLGVLLTALAALLTALCIDVPAYVYVFLMGTAWNIHSHL
mmetsp:Transcript_143625/g.203146  ORF Transcript_143625/g.203146 Transcript_143625/m.203146 type:complete len:144 (+) Transcript_143625:17-448(+)